MIRSLSVLTLTAFLLSCGGNKKTEEESTENIELTIEEESAIADELSADIQSDTEEIQKATDEKLNEVDSLLEDF